MALKKTYLILFFRYLWLALALALLIFIINKNLVSDQQVIYHLDLSQGVTADIEGLYPRSRVFYDGQLNVLAEPLYLQFYVPGNFSRLVVKGDVILENHILDLGLKQSDGSWAWQKINTDQFLVDFSLADISLDRRKAQLIFSLPDLNDPEEVKIKDLQLILANENF